MYVIQSSRSLDQKLWYDVKGLITRNKHGKYESPASDRSLVMTKIKVFVKVGQTSRSWSLGQKLWYDVKGLNTRNTHVKYESPVSHGS